MPTDGHTGEVYRVMEHSDYVGCKDTKSLLFIRVELANNCGCKPNPIHLYPEKVSFGLSGTLFSHPCISVGVVLPGSDLGKHSMGPLWLPARPW